MRKYGNRDGLQRTNKASEGNGIIKKTSGARKEKIARRTRKT